MTDREHMLFLIFEMADEWFKRPETYYGIKRSHFELLSYQKWAIDEIVTEIKACSNENPIDVVETFVDKATRIAAKTKSGSINHMFNIASDVGLVVLEVLQSIYQDAV